MVEIIIMMMITVTVCYKVRMIILGDSILITTNDFEFEFYVNDFPLLALLSIKLALLLLFLSVITFRG